MYRAGSELGVDLGPGGSTDCKLISIRVYLCMYLLIERCRVTEVCTCIERLSTPTVTCSLMVC